MTEREVLGRGLGEPRWATVVGTRTCYVEAGQGTPVVLIHGGTVGDAASATHAGDWAPVAPILAANHAVLALDRLGQGYTDAPRDASGYAMAASVAHVAAFLREIGRGPCHLVGHSRGGYVACRVALDHPELVRSATIVDSATCAPGVERNPFVFACNPHDPGTREAARWTYRAYSHSNAHVTERWLDSTLAILALDSTRETVRRMQDEGLHETVFAPRLRSDKEAMFARLAAEGLTRPVMLVWGAQDPTAPLASGHALYELFARRQPRAQMHVINAAGHFSYREQPAIFGRVLLEFLEGVECGA